MAAAAAASASAPSPGHAPAGHGRDRTGTQAGETHGHVEGGECQEAIGACGSPRTAYVRHVGPTTSASSGAGSALSRWGPHDDRCDATGEQEHREADDRAGAQRRCLGNA